MSDRERESIVEQLALVTEYSREFYEKLTNEQLMMELRANYE